jgi:hypothetical protein
MLLFVLVVVLDFLVEKRGLTQLASGSSGACDE